MICFNFQLWLWSLICWRLYPFHSLMFLIYQVHKQDPVQPLNNIINIKWISLRIRIKYLLRSKQGCCKSQLWKSGMQVTIVPKYFRTIGWHLSNNLLINCKAIHYCCCCYSSWFCQVWFVLISIMIIIIDMLKIISLPLLNVPNQPSA